MEEILAAVVSDACRRDPSLPADVAQQLAEAALQSPADADAPTIARLLLDRSPDLDASWVNAVAATVAGVRAT